MDGASSEGRSEYVMRSAGGRTFRLLSRGAFAAAGITGVIALLLVYRLWILSTSRLPEGFPGGWLLSLSDLAVAPFQDYEHSAPTTKQTGFVDFPAFVALEVCLVVILVCAVFGYLFYLLQPHQRAVLTERQLKQPRRPLRIVPAFRDAAVAGQRGISDAIVAMRGQDWAGYRAVLAARGSEVIAWLAAACRAYIAGCERDAAWLRERWQQGYASAGPGFASSDRQLKVGLLRARRSLRRTWIAVVRLTMRASALIALATTRAATAFSALGAGARSGLERGSTWYWSNFDATSNRVAAASKLARRDETFPAETQELASEDAEGEQLSRREFLRRLRPLR